MHVSLQAMNAIVCVQVLNWFNPPGLFEILQGHTEENKIELI